VNAAGIPGVHALSTAEVGIADEGVTAAIVVSSIVVGAVMILLKTKVLNSILS
jgi:hypothetical protein